MYKVLVVGGGIAGLTAAAALCQGGHHVDLIELKPQLGDNGGVGLTLVGNAMRALAKIGVAEACVAAGVPADMMTMLRPDGSLLMENPLPRIGGQEWPGATGIARPAFHAVLSEAAEQAGVRTRCGTTLQDWAEDSDGVDVRLSNGSQQRYDLVVCADGLYSKLRERIIPGSFPAYTGQAVWRAATPRPPSVDRTHIYLGGPHGVAGICPVSPDMAYIYVVEAAPENPWLDALTLHIQMRAKLEGYGGLIRELAATLDRPENVKYGALDWIMAPAPWGSGRVRMIGDAVHANPPVLAQGAAMAIEDAVVLAEEMNAPGGLERALDRFVARRHPRAQMVVDASCQLARWEVEHTPNVDVAGVMRKAAMALAQTA